MALLALPGAVPAAAQDEPWAQYHGLQALDIPYANGPIGPHHVPQVWLQLHGSAPRRFGMDTGSTGIVVSAEHYIPAPGDSDDGPGRLIYNSSGRILNGERHTTDVVIEREAGQPIATARVQVLRVTHITCLERARECQPESDPRGVAFMGVGFARHSAQGTEAGPARNPFTSLTALASGAPPSSVRPGYVVTRSGVHLGMTPQLAQGFAFVKLLPNGQSDSDAPQWNAAPMTVSVDGVEGDGTILMDTGINYMFLSPPAGTGLARGTRAPAGTRIAISLPDSRQRSAHYAFTVGDRGNPLHPEKVEVVRDRVVFVNTGRMFLEGFDYLYDATGGFVGYRWNGRLSEGFGGVTPGLAAR
ncbi:MAG: hypothetical protein JOY64_20425 [Alphaproteobacteria bacterium]|nr:hypothetical protein [Alphaproteobacteria bacterium]MBV8410005.1 hypothetical protein [Alphaproteobacteria bacterium]